MEEIMSVLTDKFELSNGVQIPKIGFGTWQIHNNEVVDAVRIALEHGYRHIDTAAAYGNEVGVGDAVRASGLARSDVFITSKIPAEFKSYEKAVKSIDESLERLNLEYIDLLLIHAPKPWVRMFIGTSRMYFDENAAIWKAMEEAYKAGKVKAIGVSNFSVADIKNIQEHSTILPMVNQIKFHIGWTQDEVVEYCNKLGILVEAYSPIATGRLLHNDEIAEMAKKYGKSIPQVCIRYTLQKGTLPLPKSTHEEYIAQNADVDFVISEEDMQLLDAIELKR
jgi:diketogulonate reductase-like aldo/keto reductase